MFRFKVINQKRHTHWIIGAIVDQVTPFDNTGYAIFTVKGVVSIGAHVSEVQRVTTPH